ncbi:MAG: hypothetical protein NTZ43_13645 [Gemmatimonadetes bacterium]|nr:hypothetical protein [Gemmatimonadota bacterium]
MTNTTTYSLLQEAPSNKECITNRDALKTWISKQHWDIVVQFQPKSDAVTTIQYQFANQLRAKSVRRIAGVNTSASYKRYSHSNPPKSKTVTIARQQVDAVEYQQRLQGTFRRELKKHLKCGIKMLSIVEQYADKRAHGAVYMSAVGMNNMSDDVIIQAAKKANLVIGRNIHGAYFISTKSANEEHYCNKIKYLMKTLGNKHLEDSGQLDNSQDSWEMSEALYSQFAKERGLDIIHHRTPKSVTHFKPKYADISKDVMRFGWLERSKT